MNPTNSNMGAGRSNSQPFLKDSCRVNLVVKVHIAWRASAERLGLAAHPASTQTTRWRKSARPGCVKSAGGVTPRQWGSFWAHRAAKSPESVYDTGGPEAFRHRQFGPGRSGSRGDHGRQGADAHERHHALHVAGEHVERYLGRHVT